MNGPCTITMAHLADAVTACNEDPHVQPPRIKLGHTSAINGDGPDYDPFAALGDAEPSFGVFTNLRLINDGAVLVGDADNVPAWLAEIAPAAYPNRSVEAVWDIAAARTDVQTAGGRRYQMVLTAVALLGVHLPAVSDLEDLQALMADGPSALAATSTPPAPGAQLSVSYDTVRHRFNWAWAVDREGNDFDGDTTWWWARDVRFDPNEVIADDEEGNLWSVTFTTDGEDAITFAEPARVRQTYVPVAAARAASFSRPNKTAERPALASKPSPKSAAPAAPIQAATARPEPEGVQPMDADVREFLAGRGIDPDSATAVQINAAKALMPAAPPEGDEVGPGPEAEADETSEGQAEVETPETERVPVAASRQLPEGAVIIDAEELARLRAGAETAARLATEQADRERNTVLAAARDEGRFPPARLSHYEKAWKADPEGTRILLTADEKDGGLAKGTVPLAAKSESPDPEGAGADGLTGADRELLAASRARMGFKVSQEA